MHTQMNENNQSTTNNDLASRNSWIKKSKAESSEAITFKKKENNISFELTEGSEMKFKQMQDEYSEKTYATPELKPRSEMGDEPLFMSANNSVSPFVLPTFKLSLDNKVLQHQFGSSSPASFLLPKLVTSSSFEEADQEESEEPPKFEEIEFSNSGRLPQNQSQSQIKINIDDYSQSSQKEMMMTLGVPDYQKRHRKSISMSYESQHPKIFQKSIFQPQRNKSLTFNKPSKESVKKNKMLNFSKAMKNALTMF